MKATRVNDPALPLKAKLAARIVLSVLLAVAIVALPSGGFVYGPSDSAYAEDAAGDVDLGDAGGGDAGDGGGSQAGTGDDQGESGDQGGQGDSGGTSATDPKIQDVMIYTADSNDCYGSYTGPNQKDYTIRGKGGQVDFEDLIQWDTWDENWNYGLTTWSVSDPSVASITQGGVLTAISDGTVQVFATVPAAYSATGSDISAVCTVHIAGQEDARYVTDLHITDENGNEFNGGTCIITEDLSTAMKQFYVDVDVYNSSTGETERYCTKDGMLSEQVPGLSDVVWYMSDSSMGSVDETLGTYRPARYGTMVVNVSSNAGQGNSSLYDSVTVSMRDPDGGTIKDDYHPQETLTVKAYYELYPPADLSDEDAEEFVINKTFDLDDLMLLGTETHTYTALGGGSYYTMTGTGPTLSSVLSAAGVNMDGIATINFGTADSLDRPVSYEYLVGTDRYYYPNVDIGSYAEAQQVYPILAIESNAVQNASTEPDYNMNESTRYRLLFGSAGPNDHSSQYQIKWINTLYVVLSGGPEVKPGEGGGDGGSGTGDDGSGTGGGDQDENGGDGDSSGTGGAGDGTDNDGSGSGSDDNGASAGGRTGGNSQDAAAVAGNTGNTPSADEGGSAQSSTDAQDDGSTGSTANQQGDEDATQASADAGGDGASASDEGSAGAFSVYQVLNNEDSTTQTTFDPENPFKKLVVPIACIVLLAGVGQSIRWYLLQTRLTVGMQPQGGTA